MLTTNPTPTNNAADVAAKFQVAELEPRQENMWAGEVNPGPFEPSGPDGSGPQPGNQ